MKGLQKFIAEVGDEKASEIFGEKLRTVRSYRYGSRWPRLNKVEGMIKKSGGKLRPEDFIYR